MKKLLLLLFFIVGFLSIQAQESSIFKKPINKLGENLFLKIGLNLVDDSDRMNPFEFLKSFDEMAFSENFNFELEYRISNFLSLSVAWSFNKWKANKGKTGGVIINSGQRYLATDLDLKYYYDDTFGGWFERKRSDWLDLYVHAGVGDVLLNYQTGTTFNFGPGVNFWLSDQIGLNFNGSGKWLLNKRENVNVSNHFQYSASLMFRFIDNDYDNDGVKNNVDDCPKVFGVAKNKGCPEELEEPEEADSDGDGVVDSIDECPNVYGTVNGCPEAVKEVDTDGDSVPDSVDKCLTVPGSSTNSGCPYGEVSIDERDTHINIKSKEIYFDKGYATLRNDSYPNLIIIVEMMKEHPEAHFRIEGHTDNSGTNATNLRLSDMRADAVLHFLINSGIPSENLITIGFGESRPVASNNTREGQALNRRVEIIRIK